MTTRTIDGGAERDRRPERTIERRAGLDGAVALVTGGGRGLGEATCRSLAEAGAAVISADVELDRASSVAESLSLDGLRAEAVRLDVTDRPGAAEAIRSLLERHGRIDVLVNNAGAIRDNPLAGFSDADVQDVLDINVTGVFNMTRAVAPYMISRRRGRIVNLSSVSGEKGGRGQTNYAASKGAINAFTRALAVELAPRKIAVNAVAPGVIETEMSEAVRELAGEEVRARILMKRFGKPEEIARAVWFLASDHASYITGQVLTVDGGFKME